MKQYKAKTLFGGLIAVPEKEIAKSDLEVVFKGQKMKVKKDDYPIRKQSFDDKWGRGRYTLNYYPWKPIVENEKQLTLNEQEN